MGWFYQHRRTCHLSTSLGLTTLLVPNPSRASSLVKVLVKQGTVQWVSAPKHETVKSRYPPALQGTGGKAGGCFQISREWDWTLESNGSSPKTQTRSGGVFLVVVVFCFGLVFYSFPWSYIQGWKISLKGNYIPTWSKHPTLWLARTRTSAHQFLCADLQTQLFPGTFQERAAKSSSIFRPSTSQRKMTTVYIHNNRAETLKTRQ